MAVEHSLPVSAPVVLAQAWSLEFIEFAVESRCEFPVVFPEDFAVDNLAEIMVGYGDAEFEEEEKVDGDKRVESETYEQVPDEHCADSDGPHFVLLAGWL